MPGHIKLSKTGLPDPDPSDYLVPSMDTRRKDMAKPYDTKGSVWIPDPKTGGFREGILESGDLDDPKSKCVVAVAHEKFTHKAAEVGKVNPPKFEKCEDMVNLTFLNDPSVFWNLKTRYQSKLIHTNSGLFMVVVNPYKRYPLYTHRVAKVYLGKRRNEVPPHLWAIAETAYRGMINNQKNQAMLITGESGAGKTENTKKVITYLAIVASSGKKSERKISIEDQIVATNPILESYGNAKTSRNDNSSRFGKFIRIFFNPSGKLAGCDIVSYLLEKSRITEQQEVERSYHIFYQMVQDYGNTIASGLKNLCQLSNDIYDYSYVSQGKTKVESIDDNEELEFTEDAFNVLGFLQEEKLNCYKLTAAVMTFGEVEFVQKGRDEQAECPCMNEGSFTSKAAALCGIDVTAMIKAFCKPRIKVGTEWVTKGQNVEQATNAVGGIARATYERLFKWLIEKCNETLIDSQMKKTMFCAVLDIAGFEIFDYNGFEQLSINFVNEKLQQFFNHHMFVVEQETYIGEGIDWQMVDFGLDLQACIVMFEKPMGLWAILEEESLFPKATDKTLEDKLNASLGKIPVFLKPQSKTDKHAHFAINHYAGIVSYNVSGWLEKNKDPVNDTVIEVIKSTSTNDLLVHLWRDHPGQPTSVVKDDGKKKKKGNAGKTVSSVYLQSLQELMKTLNSCEPHFVRCIVPNNHKQPGAIEAPLVMHQLTCNGVLEGIRICMRGFPNRIEYKEFRERYWIVAKEEITSSEDEKKAVLALMNKISFPAENYRLGNTMVFFRAGAMAKLEEIRDDIVMKLTRKLQGEAFKYLKRAEYIKKRDRIELLTVCQANLRKYLRCKDWGWFILIQKTRNLIGLPNPEEELRQLEQRAKDTYDVYIEKLELKAKLEKENEEIAIRNKNLKAKIENEQGNITHLHEKQANIKSAKEELDMKLTEGLSELKTMENDRIKAENVKKEKETEVRTLKSELQDLDLLVTRLEQEKSGKDHTIQGLNDQIAQQDEVINKMNKTKKIISEGVANSENEKQVIGEKLDHLLKVKSKLENTLDDLENSYDKEKRARALVEKERRKIEGDLKIAQQQCVDIERDNKEQENTLARKEKELSNLQVKLDGEQVNVSKSQKSIKELQGRVEDLEDELEAERQARAKADRQRSDMARELDELNERLNEASGATEAQIELNKKRDAEISRLRKDLEEVGIQHESNITSLKKRHQDAMMEMNEQIEQLSILKHKIEKDKYQIITEIDELRAGTEEVDRSKASAEKSYKSLSQHLAEINKKNDTSKFTLADFENAKQRLNAENADLLRQLQELDNTAFANSRTVHSLAAALKEQQNICEDESRERAALLAKYRNLEHQYDGLREHYDDEIVNRDNILHQLKKVEIESSAEKKKYEIDGLKLIEELEGAKLKLQTRLAEAENTLNNLNNKQIQLEKAKNKVELDIKDMTVQLDQAVSFNAALEKKAKQYDRIVGEWRDKVESTSLELDSSQNETRKASADLFQIKNAYEESVNKLDEVRKENKTLTNDIKDIMDQISEGGRSIHEIEKIRKRLEAEKLELESALSEAESALEQEENKVVRLNIDLAQVKQEIEKRLLEKDEEFQMTRKNYAKTLESMQSTLESEAKSKVDALRIKKRLEADVLELEAALETTNAANMDIQRNIARLQQNIRQAQINLDDVKNSKAAVHDRLLSSERQANTNKNGLEEVRTQLEQVDRNRRALEMELADTNEVLGEQTVQNQALTAGKRKLEQENLNLQNDLDELRSEAQLSAEKARNIMLDAARLADELRAEQMMAQQLESDRKLLEAQVKDKESQLDEVEQSALKSGRKAMSKMETRIRELESCLDHELRKCGDSVKNVRKSERKIAELTFQQDEDRKNGERMQGLIDQLQSKVRTYKKQIEEAEEIAALNLAKYRQVQLNAEESVSQANLTETALAKVKLADRAAEVSVNEVVKA